MGKEEDVYKRLLDLIEEFQEMAEIEEGDRFARPVPQELEKQLYELEKLSEAFQTATAEAVMEVGETTEHLAQIAKEIPSTLPKETQEILEKAKALRKKAEDQALTFSLAYDLLREEGLTDQEIEEKLGEGIPLTKRGKIIRKGWKPMR